MINLKKIIKEQLTKSFFFVLFSSLIFTGVILAVTWPSSPPTNETPGGNFMNYFNNMLVNTGSTTQGVVNQAESLGSEGTGAVVILSGTNVKTLGSLQFGYDAEPCIIDKAGATRYSHTNQNLEYCNSNTWKAIGNDIGSGAWTENSGNVYRDTGNVGIGTASPSQRLDVNGTIRAIDFGVAGSKNLIIGDDSYFTDIDSPNFLGIYGIQNPDRVGIRLGSNGPYIYGNNTNIGIDTTNPAQRLHVNGNIRADGRHIYLGASQNIYGDNSSRLYFSSNHDTSSSIELRDKQNTRYGLLYGDGNGSNFGLLDGDGNWSYLAVKDNYTQFRINNSAKMTIKSDGKVGIGRRPSAQLDVQSTIRTHSSIQLDDANGNDNQRWMINGRDHTLNWSRVDFYWNWDNTEMTLDNGGNLRTDGGICDGYGNCIRKSGENRSLRADRNTIRGYHKSCNNRRVRNKPLPCMSACHRYCSTGCNTAVASCGRTVSGHGFKGGTVSEENGAGVLCDCWK